MGSGNFYLKQVNTKKNVKGNRFLRSFLIAGLLLMGMPLMSKANTAPVFQYGTAYTITVCQNSNIIVDPFLTIIDPDAGQGETWSSTIIPTYGTLSQSASYNIATGGYTSTSGWTYTPNPGTTGIDNFTIKIDDGNGGTSTIAITVVVSALPSVNIVSIPPVCAGATSTQLFYDSPANIGPDNHNSTIAGNSTWIVPPGVNSVDFDLQGGTGGMDDHSGLPNPGLGGRVQGTLSVVPGQVLNINVGGQGANGSVSGAAGGFNGGGNANFYFFGCGGAGGGASDIRIGGNGLANRVVVAGGGGGNGWDSPGASCGGDGGNLIGGASCNNVGGGHASGGTQLTGGSHATYVGWTPGGNGSIGTGGDGSVQGISGGGGGGYFGGGGGVWCGGGGGSSFADGSYASSVVMTQGYNIAGGAVLLHYTIPGTYDITWDPAAIAVGFVNVSGASFPASPITIAIPPGAPAGTYNANFTLTNNLPCTSNIYPINVTINPIPDVAPITGQAVCNTDNTVPVFFSGTVSGTTFDWTNGTTSIGLGASGTGTSIGSFTAANISAIPVFATITVKPSAAGCDGATTTFTYSVNPTPMLSSSLSAGSICDSNMFHYYPASGTPGSSFIWFRTYNPGITVGGSSAGGSGAGDPAEQLHNITSDPVVVQYQYTLAANGCTYSQFVYVTVNPTPKLGSSLNPPAVCSGTPFVYAPWSATAGTTFAWSRSAVPGISNSAWLGTNGINETLINTTAAPVVVSYVYTLVANGCPYTQTVMVTVNPSPVLNTNLTPPAICSGTLFPYGPGSATIGTTFSWNRPFTPGISTSPNFGADSINETLTNITPDPVVVNYTYTLMANGCSNTQNLPVTVNPSPKLNNSTLSPKVCDSTLFNYYPTSLTAGTSFTWTRAVVANITAGPGSGFGNPMETLVNTSASPQVVTYIFTLSANGCSNTQNVLLTVNPKPTLSSTLTPAAICDSSKFDYNPTSNTAGTTFAWEQPYVPGIYAMHHFGTNNPNDTLINSTYVVVDVPFTYTLTANGCSNVEVLSVAVNPTPKLLPPFTGTVCSGSPFTYVPNSYTPGTIYQWNRPQVSHITPVTAFSTGNINETLTNDSYAPVFVEYFYRLSVNGCINLYPQSVKVKVNPTPTVPAITTYPPNNLCSGTMYQNFGSNTPLSPLQYHWTATNATVYGEGTNNQYALVNFNIPNTTAVVTLTSNVSGFSCSINNSYIVKVGSGVSENPQVIYYNGQFICLKNDNGSYQWGYDDSKTLDSTIIPVEIDQNYNNSNPDFNNRNYWVITKKDECMQKSYYNRPSGIGNVNDDQPEVKVYPNPTNQILNVEITSVMGGKMQAEILNMLGQKMDMQPVINNKATFDVAGLPSGVYLVDCYNNGVRIGTSRFIKN